MSDDAPLPRSRLARLGKIAALGARSGLRRLSGQSDPAGAAELLSEHLSGLRGLALKLGQMASYVDGLVPEEGRATYEAALARLRDQAASMPAAAVRRVLARELGGTPEELFQTFEARPFASASIGQVHRATLADGRLVAVKIQYEGVEQAVQSDLANSKLLGALLGPVGSKFGLADQLAELRARFLEELDYRHEAAAQLRFQLLFAGDPWLRVPTVIPERSAQRVLTTTLATGLSFDQALRAPEADRRAWAESLFRFVFGSVLWEGVLNADPHPGNYIFEPGGVVHVLDFGCTRQLSPEKLRVTRRVHQACVARDDAAFLQHALELVEMRPGTPQGALAEDYVRACFAPVLRPGPYTFTREFAAGLVAKLRAQAKLVALSKASEVRPLPAELLFFNRLQVGFYSVLARLDVAADYDAVHADLVRRASRPASDAG